MEEGHSCDAGELLSLVDVDGGLACDPFHPSPHLPSTTSRVV